MEMCKDKSDKTAIWTIGVLVFVIICLIISGVLFSLDRETKSTETETGIKSEPKRENLVSNNDSIKKLIKVG